MKPSNSAVETSSLASEQSPLSLRRILRAFTGSLLAGSLALVLYKLLGAIAVSFANKPVTSDNIAVINLSAAVRTLVLGVIALGTGVFAMAAIGLLLLGLQMLGQRLKAQVALLGQSPDP